MVDSENLNAIYTLCQKTFYHRVWKQGSEYLFGFFWNKLAQSAASRESFVDFKEIITNCYKTLDVTGCGNYYKKVNQVTNIDLLIDNSYNWIKEDEPCIRIRNT